MTQRNSSIQIKSFHPLYMISLISFLGLLFLAWGCIDSRTDPRKAQNRPLSKSGWKKVKASMLKEAPKPQYKLNVTFSTKRGGSLIPSVLLYGVDVSPKNLQRGKDVTLTYYFKPLRKLASNWIVFLHAEADKQHRHFVNHDHHPIGGLYPTKRWIPNRIFRSSYTFKIPRGFPGKNLNFYSGFWQARRGNMILPISARSAGKNRLLLASVPLKGKGLRRPIYIAYRIKTPPVIDGKLNEGIWKQIPSTGRWPTYNNLSGRFKTDVRLAWDSQYLYAGFYCEDDDIWARYKKRDDPIFKEEVIEFYVDANRNFRDYIELQVSPTAVIFDSFFPRYRWPRPWGRLSYDSGMLVKVHIEGTLNNSRDRDKFWTVEMRLPLSKLGPAHNMPPRDGDSWLINFYRLERSRRSGGEALAWSPVTTSRRGGDFHQIRRFGTLRFSTKVIGLPKPVAPVKKQVVAPVKKQVVAPVKKKTVTPPVKRRRAALLPPILSPKVIRQRKEAAKKRREEIKNRPAGVDLSKIKIKPGSIKPYKPRLSVYKPKYRLVSPPPTTLPKKAPPSRPVK